MKLCIVLLAIVGLAAAERSSKFFTESEVEAQFQKFQVDFNRHYADPSERQIRKRIFAQNLDFIFTHTAVGGRSYKVGVNQFADLTNQEFQELFAVNTNTNWAITSKKLVHTNESLRGLPASVDWVAKGDVTPVQNQGQMGDPWAFSTVAAIESAHAIRTGQLVKLSEQQVADCCNPYGASNAQDSIYDTIFQCLMQEGGVDLIGSYPDPSKQGQCRFNTRASAIGSDIFGYVDLPAGSEAALQNAVANVGPVAVGIDASQPSFQLYVAGVYDEPLCSSSVLDHTVTVVGYGSQNGNAFWKVKNSWGSNWGENGYILMSRDKNNQCGIASMASYPLV